MGLTHGFRTEALLAAAAFCRYGLGRGRRARMPDREPAYAEGALP
jgi:hypothetical protein